MGIVISVVQQSGGVGKSTNVFNLSHIYSDMGMKVLSIENETQSDLMAFYYGRNETLNINVPEGVVDIVNGNIVTGNAHALNLYKENTNVKPIQIKPNLSFIGSTKHLSPILSAPFEDVVYTFMDNVRNLKSQYDIILIDCPPTESNLQKAALLASDYALIPTFLEQKSIGGIAGTIQLINSLNSKIKAREQSKTEILGIFIAQYSYTNNVKKESSLVLEQSYYEKLMSLYPEHLLKSKISYSVKIRESAALSQSIIEYVNGNKSSNRIANEYQALANEILKLLNGR